MFHSNETIATDTWVKPDKTLFPNATDPTSVEMCYVSVETALPAGGDNSNSTANYDQFEKECLNDTRSNATVQWILVSDVGEDKDANLGVLQRARLSP